MRRLKLRPTVRPREGGENQVKPTCTLTFCKKFLALVRLVNSVAYACCGTQLSLMTRSVLPPQR